MVGEQIGRHIRKGWLEVVVSGPRVFPLIVFQFFIMVECYLPSMVLQVGRLVLVLSRSRSF